jgi:hypothetical protein
VCALPNYLAKLADIAFGMRRQPHVRRAALFDSVRRGESLEMGQQRAKNLFEMKHTMMSKRQSLQIAHVIPPDQLTVTRNCVQLHYHFTEQSREQHLF